jgi:hypothetical protein
VHTHSRLLSLWFFLRTLSDTPMSISLRLFQRRNFISFWYEKKHYPILFYYVVIFFPIIVQTLIEFDKTKKKRFVIYIERKTNNKRVWRPLKKNEENKQFRFDVRPCQMRERERVKTTM